MEEQPIWTVESLGTKQWVNQFKKRVKNKCIIKKSCKCPTFPLDNNELLRLASFGKGKIDFKCLSPDDFLRLAQQTTYDKELREKNLDDYIKEIKMDDKLNRVKKGLDSGAKFPPLFIDFENGIPTEHEGRHRALAAKELNIKKVPVLLFEN